MDARFKRMVAFVIDWNISLFPFLFIHSFLVTSLKQESEAAFLVSILFFLFVILGLVAFIFRDVIFKRRSLGKRIFGLYVYDKSSLEQASVKQRLIRNVFLFIYTIDGIILLATGETIGDRVAGTLVTSKKGFEAYKEAQDGATDTVVLDEPAPKKGKNVKPVLIVAIILVGLIIFAGLIQFALNSKKDSEEYKIAYSYFVESEAFKELNVDESKIRFNQYSMHSSTSKDGNYVSQTVEIGFMVGFKSFEVVCHKENDIWQVCNNCTLFE